MTVSNLLTANTANFITLGLQNSKHCMSGEIEAMTARFMIDQRDRLSARLLNLNNILKPQVNPPTPAY